MKKINLYLMLAAFAGMAASCAEDIYNPSEEGQLALNTTISEEVDVISRAYDAESLKESCEIWISNSKGLVRRYQGVGEIPASINLVNGAYVAEAWAGDSVSASFDKRCYKGRVEFDIKSGVTTRVDLACKIANVVASVSYPDNIGEALTDYTMTIGHKKGTLDFVGNEKAKGYFMMPNGETDLTYTLRGKLLNGDPFEYSGVIANAKPTTWYVLNIEYHGSTQDVGGAAFSIVIDKHEIVQEDGFIVTAAPKFSGYGFELSEGLSGESKSFGRQTVYIASANDITSVRLSSDSFSSLIPALGGSDFDILSTSISQTVVNTLNEAGITWRKYDQDGGTIVQVNFEETFTNALENGIYDFEMVATDNENLRSRATVRFNVSDAKAEARPVETETITLTGATLRGVVTKEGVENVGFRYRKAGAADWKEISATPLSRALAVGSTFEAKLTGLESGTKYEYLALFDGSASNLVLSFFTDEVPVIPNGGFETWNTSAKAWLVAADENSMFWDSGNHGSSTMNKNITGPESTIKHSGNYSAKLESQFVGIGALGKFAAGNVFIGKYLATEGTDGILGWGRPFDFKYLPKAVRVWVKYSPATINSKEATTVDGVFTKNTGDLDEGIVYLALCDDTDTGKNTYESETWSVVVKTKSKQLFSKNDANVVAYAEKVFTEATAGDGLIEFVLPIEYFKQNTTPTRLMFVASASRYGDYFCGGRGSVMYIDDIELIYE